MDTECAPPLAWLAIGYLEKKKFFTQVFYEDQCTLIVELSKSCIVDGFIIWRLKLKFGNGKETQISLFLGMKSRKDEIRLQ